MKRHNSVWMAAGLLILMSCTGVFAAGSGFDQIKTLVGQWKGKTPDGHEIRLTYSMISGGTAVMEKLETGTEEMNTIYYPDGPAVMMTHFCMANNQPRMKADAAAGAKSMIFSYVDATNLASPDAGRMNRLVMTFQDGNHMTQDWTWADKGQQSVKQFVLERVQ